MVKAALLGGLLVGRRLCALSMARRASLSTAAEPKIHSRSSTVDREEISRFDELAADWWNEAGPMQALHSMNQLRVPWIANTLVGRRASQDECLPLKDVSILDVGCGGGVLTEPLARLGASVTGVDASTDAIETAQDRLRSQQSALASRITYVNGDVESPAVVSAAPFTAVVASEVIEHVEGDPYAFVAQLARCVAPGGALFFTTINRTLLSRLLAIELAEKVLRVVPSGVHDHDKFVPPARLEDMLAEAGCTTRLVHGLCYNPLMNVWRWSADTNVNYALYALKM